MYKPIVLATNNPHKLQEYREILAPMGYVIYGTKDLNIDCDPPEIGNTYEENAYIKAKALRNLVPYPVISDDSGLEIEALDNFPGIHSARFASQFKNYKEAMEEILKRMKDKENRNAAFHCTICLLENKDSKPLFFSGICPGKILDHIEGEHGFGYDPIFFSNEANMPFGLASEEIKNKYSHRKKALEKLALYLAI